MTHPWTAIEQAELLRELIERFLAGQLWTIEQRKDASILVGLLNEYSRAAEIDQLAIEDRMNTLQRKLWDDSNADLGPE